MKTNIYIDSANLHKGAKELFINLDYKKFHRWLQQKYRPDSIYLFIGYIPRKSSMYEKLTEYGYTLIFKETTTDPHGRVKGNCDAELVLQATSDFYTNLSDSYILITGDGDFRCLVDFLHKNKCSVLILAPNVHKCSKLLKRSAAKLTFLNDHYHKFT